MKKYSLRPITKQIAEDPTYSRYILEEIASERSIVGHTRVALTIGPRQDRDQFAEFVVRAMNSYSEFVNILHRLTELPDNVVQTNRELLMIVDDACILLGEMK